MIRQFLPLSVVLFSLGISPSWAAVSPLDFTVNTSETVVVDTTNGTPSINLDVGGVTRQAVYQSGSNSNALVFRYTPVAGDVDLDGVALGSAINPNSGLLRDTNGNAMTNFTVTPPSTPNVKINYPSLSMDFVYDADGRYTLDGTAYDTLATFLSAAGGSFTRSSIGTYYDSSGILQTASSGTPRFDHDPATHAAKGILIEEGRTNLLTRSAEMDNAAWSKVSSTVTANAETAPDGIASADLVTAGAIGTNTGHIYPTNISGSFTTYTYSIYAKANTQNKFRFQPNSRIDATFTGYVVNFDLGTLTSSISGSYGGKYTNTSASITNVGNGWYRCSTTYTLTGTAFDQNLSHWIYPYPGTGGTIGDSLYFWGAQVEQGALPTSYIPTTTAVVTRARDVISIPTGSWFSGTTGTQMVKQYYTSTYADYSPMIGSAQGNSIGFSYQGSSGNAIVAFVDGSARATTGGLSSSSTNFVAVSNSSSGVAVSRNGGTVGTGSGKTLTGATTLYLGRDFNGTTSAAPKWVEKYRFYPVTVTDTQLQLLAQ